MPSMARGTWTKFTFLMTFIRLHALAQGCVGSCGCTKFSVQGQVYQEYIVNCSGLSLSTVPKIPVGTTQLFLSNNKISALDVNIFKSLTNLWKIDVSNNQLEHIPNDIFQFNSKLNYVNFGENPLTCDCELHGLHNLSQHVKTFVANCAKPSALASLDVKTLKVSDYCGGCLGIKLSGKGSDDKVYYIKLKAKCEGTVPIYCSRMNTSSPKEYIALNSRLSGNYALIYDYRQPEVAKSMCDRQPGGTIYNQAGLTNFTKVRLVVSSSEVSIKNDDFFFAVSRGKPVPLGVAGDCFSASKENCRKGRFSIDLTGTGFRFKDTVHWEHYGTPAGIQTTLDINAERRIVYGECGGYCGGCRPQGSLQLELNSCPEEGIKPCISPLGMDDRSIDDKHITASSFKPNYQASNGRLNHIKTDTKGSSWCAGKSDKAQHLQIDLGKQMTLSGLATQGSGESQDWVKKYKIMKSDNGQVFEEHREFGLPVEFTGNVDNFNIVTHWFDQRFRARYVRVVPTQWQSSICLRVELFGCDNDMVSVAVRHKTDRRCWSPNADQCSFKDGINLVLKPSCTKETDMFAFLKDRTIKHTCSGKCVFISSSNKLSLRSKPCDVFVKKKKGDSYQIIHNATKQCTELSDAKKGELSLQSCDASSDSFELTQDSISPMSPKITVKTTYLMLNKPGWVYCHVIADPLAQIYWSKTRPWPGGQRLSRLDFLEWSNGSLYVRHARMSYAGQYYCSAANTANFVSGRVDIKVGSPPRFIKSPNNTEVLLNETAVLDCVFASSNLPTNITWFKQPLHHRTSISVDKLDQRFLVLSNMSLKINKVGKSDEAYYTCESSNPLGTVNRTAFLKVLIPPSFFIFPKNIEIPSSSSPMISCKGVGDPNPSTTWSRKNGSALPKSAKVYGNGSLFIRDIQLADQGIYVCSATSQAGSVHAEITIRVYGACRIDNIPFATYHPRNIFFPVGSLIVIKCVRGYQMREGYVTNMTCISDGKFSKALPKCKDVDECQVDPATDENNHDVKSYHACNKNALCINTVGSYRCECSEGFKGNGTHCTSLCPRPTNPPNSAGWVPDQMYYEKFETTKLLCVKGFKPVQNASVTCNSVGSFGLLPKCQDINECALVNTCPDSNKVCKNLEGSYQCDCKKGLEEDGRGGCHVAVKRIWKVSPQFQLLLKQFKNSKSANSSTSLKVLEAVKIETDEKILLSGDLLAVYEILKLVADKAKDPGPQATKKQEIKVFTQVCSNILRNKNEKQWKNIQKENKGVTQVMLLIEDYIATFASFILTNETAIILKSENLDVKIYVAEAQSLYKGYRYSNNDKTSQISVPGKVFQDYESGSDKITVTAMAYKSLANLLPQRADGVKSFDIDSSTILSTSLHPKPKMHDSKLAAPVEITLGGEKTTKQDSVARCVFWDFEKKIDLGGSWSSEGCRVVSSTRNSTVCECDHMTTFASLAVYDKPFAFTLVVYIACGILCLVVIVLIVRHLYLYCKLKSERSIIHLNLCLAIAACLGLFVGTLTLTKIKIVCIVIAVLLHYFLLAIFCWIISKCLQIFQTLTTGKNKNTKRVKWFYIIGWVLPAIAVGISLGVFQLQGYGNREWCWLDYDHILMWAFAGPIAFFLFITFILVIVCSVVKARVVDSSDKTKVSVSLAMAMLLAISVACTWVSAAIYVKNHQSRLWEYVFAGSCVLQALILLLFGFLDKQIKNFSFLYQIKKIQQKEHKEKRNYYSTTDTVQYYGGANAPDGKTYTVTRPSAKESTQDLRGSSKRLARIGSNQEVSETQEYPPPIIETPIPLDESYRRKIENRPVPYTPSFPNSEVIQLQTFPGRRGYQETPQSSDRQPDGAEYPEPSLNGDRRVNQHYRSSSPRGAEGLSSQSKLAQIPEREPLMRGYREDESLDRSDYHSRLDESKPPTYEGERDPLTSDPSRRRSQRSRARLEEQFKNDLDSINKRKKKLRYSSGYLIGATIDDYSHASKDHASL